METMIDLPHIYIYVLEKFISFLLDIITKKRRRARLNVTYQVIFIKIRG